jgi:hypothetical protein
MRRLVHVIAVLLVGSAMAAPAFAQGGYISASLIGDVVRLDQYDASRSDAGNGEALGFALRVGSGLGTRWGVELEFVRPGEISSDVTPEILPLLARTIPSFTPSIPGPPNTGDVLAFPIYSYRYRTRRRNTTLSTAVWAKQEISQRFSLAYLGGVSFGRTSHEIEVSYEPVRPTILPIPPSVSQSTLYDVGPMAGVEGRIRLGGQVDLVPGIRLHGVEGGWLIRPALGLAWAF